MRKLEKRDRVVLTVGGIMVAVILAYLGVTGPLQEYENSKALVVQARQRLMQAQTIAREVQSVQQHRDSIAKLIAVRGPSYNLFTTINRAVQIANCSDRATTSSLPAEVSSASAVKLTLTGVSMEELVNVLYEIYSKDSLVVLHRLDHLRPALDGKGLQCDLVFITPRL